MGWNVVGSCIFIWLKDNNFNWFSVEISTFKYSFESYIEKGNWGFEILIDFSIKFKALCSKIQIELLGKWVVIKWGEKVRTRQKVGFFFWKTTWIFIFFWICNTKTKVRWKFENLEANLESLFLRKCKKVMDKWKMVSGWFLRVWSFGTLNTKDVTFNEKIGEIYIWYFGEEEDEFFFFFLLFDGRRWVNYHHKMSLQIESQYCFLSLSDFFYSHNTLTGICENNLLLLKK
jgi:hypothetical protein